MVPVIRISDEVYKRLQAEARPFLDRTPDDVLRRILGLDPKPALEDASEKAVGELEGEEVQDLESSSVFIVVNAAGSVPDDQNALNANRLVQRRVTSGVDILAYRRFVSARRLRKGSMIVMHQGGARSFREKYGAGQLVAAGTVKEEAREITEEDRDRYREDYELTRECFPDVPLVGIILYEFPKGMASEPLAKETVPYYVRRGDNFIRIGPADKRYARLLEWWRRNS